MVFESLTCHQPLYLLCMRSRIAGVAFAVAALSMSACGAESLATANTDVCNINASWISAGKPPEDTPRFVRSLRAALEGETEGRIPVAASSIIQAADDGDQTSVRDDGVELAATCVNEGWEPPEG